MNDTATSASGASLVPGTTDAFTAAHLAIIAILLVLTVTAILYGMKLARRRHRAAREIDEHNATIEAALPAPAPTAAPVTTAPAEAVRIDPPAVSTTLPPANDAAPVGAGTGGDAPVTLLKGLGPKVAARLGELGIISVGQLAALDTAAAARLDGELGAFQGRMARDRWLDQARLLAAGDRAGFEAEFGKL